MASAAYGLRLPASASCLGRHLRLAGRCPNNFSLFPPLAAVVVVASHFQRKNDLDFRDTGASADAPVSLFFTGGIVKRKSICSAAFCESAALREPPQSAHCVRSQLPQGDANPLRRSRASSPEGGAFDLSTSFVFELETLPPCQRLPPRGSWQSRQALTEGVKLPPSGELARRKA